jgi:cytochrome P450
MITFTAFLALLLLVVHRFVIKSLYLNELSNIPGPKLYAITKWRLALEDWRGLRTQTIDALHKQYGPIIRIGPNEIHCNSLTALKTIYGAGSGFERTSFYSMFDVYGRQNLFTFASTKAHGDRKKLVANGYAKSVVMRSWAADLVKKKVSQYLELIEMRGTEPHEIFSSLHYFSIDSITHFLYGSKHGGTTALTPRALDQGLLNDILDPARRQLSWFAVHLPSLTKWLYSRSGYMERIIQPLLPMQKPATYTGIRAHALRAVAGSLDSLDIASECADHLLAGIDTTADSLMFLIWAISRPQNAHIQRHLIDELHSLPTEVFEQGVPGLHVVDSLPYLNAVIRETLRLYNPLPASEPRSIGMDRVIDGFQIPAGTVVNMSPYSLHRHANVFEDPLRFHPERWLNSSPDKLVEMNRWFWAFSSGGRMCIGLQ